MFPVPTYLFKDNDVKGITGKSFVDSQTTFEADTDIAHNTKLKFDLSNQSLGTTKTIQFAPSPNQTLVAETGGQNVSSKTFMGCFIADDCHIASHSDYTKKINFNLGDQTTGTTLELRSNQTTDAGLIIPDVTEGDALVTTYAGQTLSSKTIDQGTILYRGNTLGLTGNLTLQAENSGSVCVLENKSGATRLITLNDPATLGLTFNFIINNSGNTHGWDVYVGTAPLSGSVVQATGTGTPTSTAASASIHMVISTAATIGDTFTITGAGAFWAVSGTFQGTAVTFTP